MKKVIKIIDRIVTAIVLIFIIALVALMIAIPVSNDISAKNTAKEIAEIQLPEQTEYIEKVSQAGKLVGNGNGMQYFGAILIKSELSLEELKEYYLIYAENEWQYIVEKQTDKAIRTTNDSVAFKSDIDSDGYFVVYSWGSYNGIFGELADMDIRGH